MMMIDILLVSRFGLVEETAVEVFHPLLVLFYLDVIFQVLSGKIIMW